MKNFRITCLDNDCVTLYAPFWGEHGLSFLIEDGESALLLDTGTSPEILAHNLAVLEKNPAEIGTIILTHAHYDHTAALAWVLEQTNHPRLVASPDIFTPRFSRREGRLKSTGMRVARQEVESRAEMVLERGSLRIGEGIYTSGEIPRLNDFETTDERMLVETSAGLQPDSFPDDQSLILETGRGLVVLVGCCHSGLVNTLDFVSQRFQKPIHAVLGGIHLNQASQERIEKTADIVQETYHPHALYLNHCTGEAAFMHFKIKMGEAVMGCPAGTVLEF